MKEPNNTGEELGFQVIADSDGSDLLAKVLGLWG